VVRAQETVEIGQPVTATMTESEYEFEYSFSGSAGDVIVAEMRAVDPFGDLDSPLLILLDADRKVVADTTNAFSFSNALLAAELPRDGVYAMLATRQDGPTGESVGEFTLELIAPEAIPADGSISGSATREGRNQYYLVNRERLQRQLQEEERRPDGSGRSTVSTRMGGREVAAINGEELTTGMLGEFEAGTTYIVWVGRAPFSFSFGETGVDFELSITES
jgi:hypothetical protein